MNWADRKYIFYVNTVGGNQDEKRKRADKLL